MYKTFSGSLSGQQADATSPKLQETFPAGSNRKRLHEIPGESAYVIILVVFMRRSDHDVVPQSKPHRSHRVMVRAILTHEPLPAYPNPSLAGCSERTLLTADVYLITVAFDLIFPPKPDFAQF